MSNLKNSVLKAGQVSPLLMANYTKSPSGAAILKKALASGLTLTSLVDCFTILVVYLLVATSFGTEELNVPKDMQLPRAAHSDSLEKGLVIEVAVKDGVATYKIDEKRVSVENLSERLQKMKGQFDSVVIQADKKTDYSMLNPAVTSGLQAGFSKIKFAVLHGEKGS